MRTLLVIGMGTGNPDHITLAAVAAMRRVDVFFALEKSEEKADLLRLRNTLCACHLADKPHRWVTASDVVRDARVRDYDTRVRAWHDERAALYEHMLASELGEEQCGGILAWGDPSLYDSHLRILESVRERGHVSFTLEVVPGLSSVQVLAASHRIVLNRVGGSVWITTGRRLAQGLPASATDVVVMLDDGTALASVLDDVDVYWGAYVGSEHELLVAGRLADVRDHISRVRASARARHGWIMDIYLLRRRA